MRDLSDGGMVERRRKGGTHVRSDPVTRARPDIPITRKEVEQKGSVYRYRLVRKSIAAIPRTVATRFGLPAPTKMMRVEALHLADRKPCIYEDRWICLNTVPEIKDVDLEIASANEWLVHNKPYSECDVRFYAKNADKKRCAKS